MLLHKNVKGLIVKSLIFVTLALAVRTLFQIPVEFFGFDLFRQTEFNRVFSKIDALKVAVLVGLIFVLYFKDKIARVDHGKNDWINSAIWGLCSLLFISGYYGLRAVMNLFAISSGLELILASVGIILLLGLAFVCLLVAVFGYDYCNRFAKMFYRQLLWFALFGAILYYLLMFFQSLWPFFSGLVARILTWMLSLSYDVIYFAGRQAPVLSISDFAVEIGSPCSGIDSMFLFLAFMAGIFAIDRSKLKPVPFFLLVGIGAAGVYVVNVLRLYLLVLVGVHISPELAVGLFHTNAGWVLFVIYFLCYYVVIKRFIYLRKVSDRK